MLLFFICIIVGLYDKEMKEEDEEIDTKIKW
jgi:cbb3-type cytochrome oxidase subunit 3